MLETYVGQRPMVLVYDRRRATAIPESFHLREAGLRATHCETLEEATQFLRENRVSLVVVDEECAGDIAALRASYPEGAIMLQWDYRCAGDCRDWCPAGFNAATKAVNLVEAVQEFFHQETVYA